MSKEKIKLIAVEGIVKRNNTLLAKHLASLTDARTILEEDGASSMIDVNSSDPKDLIFKKHILRLLDRYKSQKQIVQTEIFHDQIISDYLFYADRIYANLKLESEDLSLYDTLFNFMEKEVAIPDLVIYLQNNTETVLEKLYANYGIKNNLMGKNSIDENYVRMLNEEFNEFFMYFRWAPVMIVNANQLNPEDPKHVQDLIFKIQRPFSGVIFYNPPITT
ncbi:deoxynucleoside kinase [bacterium]|nr:deoxynucleoside kinase [bacterium]